MTKTRKILAMLLALVMVLGMMPTATAEAVKWSEEKTADKWIKVTQEGGPTLGYHGKSGVTILTVDGFAFKDLDKDGELDVYEDWRETPEARAEDLAGKLTIAQIAGLRYSGKDPGASADAFESELDQFVRHFLGNQVVSSDTELSVEAVNEMQEMAEKAEWGVPVMPSADPQTAALTNTNPLSLAATFDTEIVFNVYNQAAKEMRAIGVWELLGPQSDLATDPRWSRANGTFGEDPALSRDLSEAAVSGLQSTWAEDGADLGWGLESVISQIKHYPGDGAAEGGRESHGDLGKYNVYPGDNYGAHVLPFFDGAFALKSATKTAEAVMPSYSIAWDEDEKYGELVGSNFSEWKIEQLRDNGFEGVIATDSLIMPDNPMGIGWSTHGVEKESTQDIIYMIMSIGIDRLLSPDFGYTPSLVKQIENTYEMMVEEEDEEFAEENFRGSAKRILRVYFQSGIFENPYVSEDYAVELLAEDAIPSFGEINQKTIVMLKNDGSIKQRAEKPTVYVPMEYTAPVAASGSSAGQPGGWNLAINATFAYEYFNVVTDTITDPTGEDGSHTINDIIRVTDEQLAACDFALVFISNPSTGSGKTGDTYTPISLQYNEYVADGDYVREKSLSEGVIETTVETPYGPTTNRTKDNRSYYGQKTVASNLSDLTDTLELAGRLPESCSLVVCMSTSNAFIPAEFEPVADVILVSFGVASTNFMPIIAGQVEPYAALPVQLPANMETVETQYEDVPRDMVCYVDANGNTYDFAFGLDWDGVIDDERVAQYRVAPLTTPENAEIEYDD